MKLSFIIPTKNEEKILERMLTSLRTLTIAPYEIVVSDGNSTDKTLEIARRLATKVVVHTLPTRQTIAMGRNAGAAQAEGNIFVCMDADVFIPDMNKFLSIALKRFEDDPKLVGLLAPLKVLPADRTFADAFFSNIYIVYLYVMNNILHLPIAQGEFQMVRAKAFRHVKGYNESLAASEDMDLFWRLGNIGRIRMETRIGVFHTGRRAHKVGWLKLMFTWTRNGLSVLLFNKSSSKEWEVIR